MTGALIRNDFRASTALTALWFVLVGVASVVASRRRSFASLYPSPSGRSSSWALTLGLASVRDVTVNETVATAPASLEGSFVGLAHPTEGAARIVEAAGGGRVLTLTDFRTAPRP